MLNITVICVGSIKESYLSDAIREYAKRIGAYARITVKECKEEHLPSDPSQGEIRGATEREGQKILAAIPPRAYVCALCIEGDQMTSEAFSRRIEGIQTEGYSELAFIIGGSDGLSEAVKKAARLKLSFSKMTFPHQLMRVILFEQIYRALNIAAGGKYHK